MAETSRPPAQQVQEGYGNNIPKPKPKRGRPSGKPVYKGPRAYVTIRDAAEAIGVTYGVVKRMVVNGDLDATKGHGVTSSWLISRKSILARFPDAEL